MLEKRKQKKIAAGGDGNMEPKPSKQSVESGGGVGEERKQSGYRQRQAVDRGKLSEGAGMESVLGSVFG